MMCCVMSHLMNFFLFLHKQQKQPNIKRINDRWINNVINSSCKWFYLISTTSSVWDAKINNCFCFCFLSFTISFRCAIQQSIGITIYQFRYRWIAILFISDFCCSVHRDRHNSNLYPFLLYIAKPKIHT